MSGQLPFFPTSECLKCDFGNVLRGGSYMTCNRKKAQERPPYCPELPSPEPLADFEARQPKQPSILRSREA